MIHATFKSSLVGCLICLILQGCASLPDTESTIADIDSNPQALKVVGAKRKYSEHGIDHALQKLSPDEEVRLSLEKHLKIEQAISGNSLYADNKVTLLFNGEITFRTMKQALINAKNHINLEYFTFEDVDLGGITLKALLLEKLSQGVKVNIIYDAIGSAGTPPEMFETLKKAGAAVTEYHPLQPETITEINQRDHRKIMVIDGKLAIIGGVNLSKTYQSKGSLKFFSKNRTLDPSTAHWRDTDAMIEGPVVADIQRTFVSHWNPAQPLDTTQFYPTSHKQGSQFVRVIATNAEKNKETDSPYYITLIAAINNAEHSIILNSAYFVPTDAQEKALIAAADRGVHIELLVPSLSDSTLSMHVQRSHYSNLLEHGIEIYEIQDQVLHAKMVSIDHVWSVIGSSNFDYRSAGINAEVDFVILGNEIATALNNRFQADLNNAKKIDLEAWKNRSILDKIKQQSSRIFEGTL